MADRKVSNNSKGEEKRASISKPKKERKKYSNCTIDEHDSTTKHTSEKNANAVPPSDSTVSDDACSCCSCPSESTDSGEWVPSTSKVGGRRVPKSPEKMRLFLSRLPIANWAKKPYPPEMTKQYPGSLAFYPAFDPGYDYEPGDPAGYPPPDKPSGFSPTRKPSLSFDWGYDYYNPGGDPYRFPDYDLGVDPPSCDSIVRRPSTCSCEYYSEFLDRDLGVGSTEDRDSKTLSRSKARKYAELIVKYVLRKARKQYMMELGIWDDDELKPRMPKRAPNYVADHKYMEPVPDPYSKAIKYLEKHCILQLFQKLTSDIVYERPKNPVDFIITEIEEMKQARAAAGSAAAKAKANPAGAGDQ